VFDYFGGLPDLEAGRVRFVGDPARRIAEDYLRVLRFFRFHARYGRQPPSAEEKAALRAAVPHLARLSAERVWNELRRILSGPNPGPALALMVELGVLAALLPEGTDTHRFGRLVDLGAPPDPILRLAGLLSPAADSHAVAERLKLSVAEADRLKAILSGPTPEPDLDDAGLRRLLANEPPDILVARTWLAGDAAPAWHRLRARLAAMPRPHFALAGRDILAAGVPPGPAVGQLLKQVRDWWIELGCEPDADACRDRLRGLLAFSSLEGGQTPRR
jgi:poly(A) polymerase/tRNA nucleotidyltransferase (CCA-adding enzyme)